MFSISAVTVSLQLTPQTIAILVAIAVVLLIILGIGGRRRSRRRRGGDAHRQERTPRRNLGTWVKRLDHDLETARKHAAKWRDAGCGYLICGWPDAGRTQVERFAKEVLPLFQPERVS